MSNGDLAAALTSEAAYVQLVQRVLAGGEPGAQQADEVGVQRHGRALVGGGRGLEGRRRCRVGEVGIARSQHAGK